MAIEPPSPTPRSLARPFDLSFTCACLSAPDSQTSRVASGCGARALRVQDGPEGRVMMPEARAAVCGLVRVAAAASSGIGSRAFPRSPTTGWLPRIGCLRWG